MEKCELWKPCTIESRNKSDMKTSIEKYYSDVKSPKGGALFAVCRGKVIFKLLFKRCWFKPWLNKPLLPDPFRGMGAWQKTMEFQKPGNFPRPGPEVVERQRVVKERAAQRARSWTVQNEIRGVLGRVFASVA